MNSSIGGVLSQRYQLFGLILSSCDLEQVAVIVDEGGQVYELPNGYIIPRSGVDQRWVLLEKFDDVLDFEEVIDLDGCDGGWNERAEVGVGVVCAEDSVENGWIRHCGGLLGVKWKTLLLISEGVILVHYILCQDPMQWYMLLTAIPQNKVWA